MADISILVNIGHHKLTQQLRMVGVGWHRPTDHRSRSPVRFVKISQVRNLPLAPMSNYPNIKTISDGAV
jgi:hypothetical protein